jgi:hypothetical protein
MNGNSDRSRAFLRNTSLAVTSPHSPQRFTCYPSAVVQPRAAILFRCYSNGSCVFLLSIYLSVTSRQIFRARFSLWRHIFPAIHPMFQRNQRRYHVKKFLSLHLNFLMFWNSSLMYGGSLLNTLIPGSVAVKCCCYGLNNTGCNVLYV